MAPAFMIVRLSNRSCCCYQLSESLDVAALDDWAGAVCSAECCRAR